MEKDRHSVRNLSRLRTPQHLTQPTISTTTATHVITSIPNFSIQEFTVTDVLWLDAVLDKPSPLRGGVFELAEKPGLDSI
jgi:L-alanine-DL-glutamate epimerase-like enolase superfamily enzyme